jgi:hypothetical protein
MIARSQSEFKLSGRTNTTRRPSLVKSAILFAAGHISHRRGGLPDFGNLNVHTQEAKQMPGLLRYVSYKPSRIRLSARPG